MDNAPLDHFTRAGQAWYNFKYETGRTGDTGAHDFIDVLGDLGLLGRAQAVGRLTHTFGVVMLFASFSWAGWMVFRQFGVRK